MVFKRGKKLTWLQWIGSGVYPKGGWTRAASYVMHRLRRLPDPPHKISRGVAAGVFASFTPFFGFHFVTAALVALVMQGNILASLLATFFGNPLTFPIIVTLSFETGNWLLGRPEGMPLPEIVAAFSQASLELWHNFTALFSPRVAHWGRLGEFFHSVFLPYLVGGIIPGIVTATVAYWLTLPAVTAYQKRRAKKLRTRFEKRRATKADAAAKAD